MSWLKFDITTPEKPEVLAITIAMGWDDPDLTVGKLIKVWRWFDAHTVDGNARSVTIALLDRIIGVTGFATAMQSAGWLLIDGPGIILPNFENHNGKTAKDRALTAKRAANHRSNDKSNAPTVISALPREDKIREDKIREEKKREENKKSASASAYADLVDQVCPNVFADWKKLRVAKKAPITKIVIEGIKREAEIAGYTLEQAMRECVERGWTGFKASWVVDKGGGNGFAQPNKQQALEDRADETLRQYLADKELKNNAIQ